MLWRLYCPSDLYTVYISRFENYTGQFRVISDNRSFVLYNICMQWIYCLMDHVEDNAIEKICIIEVQRKEPEIG